jgi:hypothetical protein
MRKFKVLIVMLIISMMIGLVTVYSIGQKRTSTFEVYTSNFEGNSRSLGVVEDTRQVYENYDEQDLIDRNFELISSTEEISMYLNRQIFNIAIVDHSTNYVWYGYYPEYKNKGYTNSVNQLIESGVTVAYYDASTLNEARMSISNPDSGTVITYENISNGIRANLDIVRIGISFAVEVSISADQLNVKIPHDSIVEVPYQTAAMRFPREYKLHSVYVFPYFGSQNYEINGYAFVPDGSGALIRYTDTPYSSAYIRRIYGRDLGFQSAVTTLAHLKTEAPITLPIFGINHGYQQSAFIAEVKSGYGAVELHSYPYRYNNVDINTTFFVYRTRDRSIIRLSGGDTSTIPLINKDPYPFDFEMLYSFLSQEQASYSGMANRYRENLNLDYIEENQSISVHLEVIGIDDKPSLLGKSNVKLTTYSELAYIVEDLGMLGQNDLLISYRSWNQGGFFGSNPNKFNPSSQLGGKKQFNHLMSVLNSKEDVELSLYHDPLVAPSQKAFQTVLRRTTLDMFYAPIDSSRIERGYYLSIEGLSNRLLTNEKKYQSHLITNLSIESVGHLQFSYQLGRKTTYREQMIDEIMAELEKLTDYQIGLYQPADYTFNYISRYYDMFHQSNLYSFMTDSIPFVSMVLSGHVELYTSHLNYVNDLEMMKLRMIEYGLSPSFMITYEESYKLRYTNYEYLYTTQYELWKDKIIDTSHYVGSILNHVVGANIINHRFIHEKVVEITYSNGVTIYVNYSDQIVLINNLTIEPLSATYTEVGS